MPGLTKFAEKNGLQSYQPAFPALTCTAQSSIVTGTSPAEHGIVANGWYDRESAEVRFWKQSNHLVRGEKLWDKLRREIPGFTLGSRVCAPDAASPGMTTLKIFVTSRVLFPLQCGLSSPNFHVS